MCDTHSEHTDLENTNNEKCQMQSTKRVMVHKRIAELKGADRMAIFLLDNECVPRNLLQK
jgi:hypothetical protein